MNAPINNKTNYIFSFLALAAVFFWGLAIVGAFNSYSPVPFMDMWDGYLDFYIKASAGDIGAWWKNHNEHRILLSRFLFWIDLSWLNGSIWFLLLVNYLLVALSCLMFFVFLRERLPKTYFIFGLFIMTWLISWSQHENLTWGFQSQFILAQLLPLIAFYLLHRAYNGDNTFKDYFFGACFFGTLSLGSMANGVITLPLMTLYVIICRFGWRWVAVLAAISCVGLLAYFHDYTPPAHHGSIGSSLRENPIGLILYVMTYIGSPFFHIAGGRMGGIALAQFAGGIMILLSTYFALSALRRAKRSTLELALLFFILYVGGTALGTAGGRLIFGIEQALASRYLTPSLMAWAALFVLVAAKLAASFEKLNWQFWLPFPLLVLAMLPMQIKALDSDVHNAFERNIAGLAVAMGVHDQSQISKVYPSAELPLSIGKIASEKGLSYFSRIEFKNINLGEPVDGFSGAHNACQGYIDYIEPIEGEKNYLRLSGWIFDQSRRSSPRTVWLINEEGIAVGYGLTGQPRPDVAKAVDKNAEFSGFKGYFLSDAQGSAVTVFSPVNNCVFPSTLPVNFFTLSKYINGESITVGENQVLSGNQWFGSDYYKSEIAGVNVIGSFIKSDADKGSVSLRIKRGDKILYRSGPTQGNQYLQFNVPNERVELPASPDWGVLEFSSKALPDSFIVTIHDNGDGWGEWFALGLLSQEISK